MRMGTIREREDSMAGNTSQPSIKRVWGIAKSPELKLTDEELHLLVQAHTGKDSIKALNKRELQTVIRVLGNMKDSAKKSERGRNRYSGSEVTENQRKKIYKLTQELGWDKPARVNGMCQKMFGVSAVEWLNYQQCSKLIEALKSMLKRQKEKEEQDEGQDISVEELAQIAGFLQVFVGMEGLKRGLDMDDVKNNMLDIHLAAMETLEEQLRAGKLDPDDSS